MSEAVYAIYDVESTGIDVFNDRIVQLFFATADANGELVDKWEWLINPGIPVPKEASDVHGFTTEFLEEHGEAPEKALAEIKDIFVSHLGLTHIAFNMSFDLSIIDAEFKRYGISETFGSYMADHVTLFDPIVADRHFDKYRKGKRTLAAQAAHYGIPFLEDDLHDAGADVALTAKVAVKIAEKFGIPTNQEQALYYSQWAASLEIYLRRTDETVRVDGNWPLKRLEEEK